MAIYFFDANALVKLYHTESGSAWVQSLLAVRDDSTNEQAHEIYLAEISIAESAAAFSILMRTNKIDQAARDAKYRDFLTDIQNRFFTLHVTRANIYRAAALTQQHILKGYDAVQLAVALSLEENLNEEELSLSFATSDVQLINAARAEGLRVENPIAHQTE